MQKYFSSCFVSYCAALETVIFFVFVCWSAFKKLESRQLCGRNCIPFFCQFTVVFHGCGGFHLSTYFCCLVIYLVFLFKIAWKLEQFSCKKEGWVYYIPFEVFNLLPFQAWFGIQHQAEIEIIELPIYFQITIVKRWMN